MSALAEGTRTALEPVRAALLAAAEAEAEALTASAEAEARDLLEGAREKRERVLQEARERGAADGEVTLSVERSRVQREARRVVLSAQQTAYDELRAQALAAVRELLLAPAERDRLTQVLRSRLGPEAAIHDRPGGGLVGESGDGRVVEASPETLVDVALASLDLESLWAPG